MTSSPVGARPRSVGFGDRLADAVASRRSQLVLGLDPDSARLWPAAVALADGSGATPAERAGRAAGTPAEGAGRAAGTPAERAGRAVSAHCVLAIEAAADQCVAVKLQLACFERLGAPGWTAMAHTVRCAREHGLLVIADGKRGDIDVSAAAYAQAYLGETSTVFGPVPGLGADALTVNPLLGRDSLVPFVEAARERQAGLFVLVRTSNPGAADVQELALADGPPVSDRLSAIVEELGAPAIGAAGVSDIGAVVGATAPGRLAGLRELMPHTVFLLPGVGAQGGRVQELGPAFEPGAAGALIAVSRGIVNAYERLGGDPATRAREEATRLRELAWGLAEG